MGEGANKQMIDFVKKYLSDHDSQVFYVEHNKATFSNHLAQGCIGLLLLGEDNEERFLRRASQWADKMEPPDGTASQGCNSVSDVDGESIESLLGQRRGFYAIRRHFQDLCDSKHEGDVYSMLAEEFVKLKKGVWSKFFHPMLLLGYGCSMDLPHLVIDGLAYLHHTYQGPKEHKFGAVDENTFGRGDLELVQIVEMLHSDEIGSELHDTIVDYVKDTKEGFKLVGTVDAMHDKGDALMDLVDRINIPSIEGDYSDVFRWLTAQSLTVYQGSELINDFFLLHGVTSAWALGQIVDKIKDKVSRSHILECLRYQIFGLLSTYIVEGRPKIIQERLENITDMPTMEQIRKQFLEEEDTTPDEHTVKIIKVAYLFWKDIKDNDDEMEVICRRAALTAMKNQFVFNSIVGR